MTLPPLTPEVALDIARAVGLLAGSALLGWVLARLARRYAAARISPAQAEVAGRLVLGVALVLGVVSAMVQLDFDLSIFVGAAGLLTVAVGFASQTSASNVISGLFLLFERPFAIGDVIRIGATTGEVVSIDLLSVRLRTFDNLLVRVPNETLLRSEITNLSHFPLRRFDLLLVLKLDADLDAAREALLELVASDPRVLDEPAAVVHFVGFLDYGAQFQISVWVPSADYLATRNALPLTVQRGLRDRGLPIAVPVREHRNSP